MGFGVLLIITCITRTIYAVPLDEFFPYGPSANDQIFPANDDGSTIALRLSRNFPYFNNNHRQIYLANNGLFSFLGPINQYVPDSFPLNDNRRLIAGFWSDIDTRGNIAGGNKVYYHIYDNSNEATVFEKAASYVRQYFPGERSFSPAMVITGTWYRVGAYSEQTNLRNTFQIILATDEMRSFAFLLYNNLQWASPQSRNSSSIDHDIGGQAGFNAGDGIVFEMLPYSRTSYIRQLVNMSNVNVPGLFVFRIDTDTIATGGCSNNSNLLFRPRRGSQLGFTAITIQGPCFTNISEGVVKCRFGESTIVDAIVINELQAICLSPAVPLPDFVNIYLSVDEGRTFQLFPNLFTYTPAEYGFSLTNNAEVMIDNQTDVIITVCDRLTLKWFLSETTTSIWPNDTTQLEVHMVIVALNDSNGGIMITDTTVLTTNITPILGYQTTSITIPLISNSALSTIFFRIVARDNMTNLIYAGLNSALFVLHNNAMTTTDYCQAWASTQPSPLTWNQDLLPCPLTLAQARVARCCYERDLTCMENSLDSLQNCRLRHGQATYNETSAIACYLSISTNPSNAGAECCYDTDGQLISRGTGSGTDDRYQPTLSPVLHFFSDTLPFLACCLLTTDRESCTSRYFNLRPTRRGSNTRNPSGGAWGDPHFSTLDGFTYTFNGYGEYTYLAIANASKPLDSAFDRSEQNLVFNAQVRTTPLTSENGSTINTATVLRGLAAISNHPLAERMSVTVSRRELLIVRRGNETLDLDTDNDNTLTTNNSLLLFFPEMTLERNQTSGVLTLSWFVGVSIQITPISTNLSTSSSVLVLGIGISVANLHKNRTFGLLGLYDNDPTNDLRAQNGSIIIPDNSFALEQIHLSFGETWLIDSNYSLFYYETGDSALFYTAENSRYQPSFSLPHPSTALSNSTYETCNINSSSTNQSTWTFSQFTCYYDIAVTNDLSFGQTSRSAADTVDQTVIDQRSSPEFNSALPVILTVNRLTNITLNFTASSPYSFNIRYTLTQGPSDANFDNQTALFNWQTPSSIESDTIVRVSAQDSIYGLLTTHELAIRIVDTTTTTITTTPMTFTTTTTITTTMTSTTTTSTPSSNGCIISVSWILIIFNIIGIIYFF